MVICASLRRANLLESGGKMETKAKYILVMVAMCILITPAFSQGGERDGRNGNPGSNNAMMSGPNGTPFGQGGEIEPGQAPDALRFKGCNTRLENGLGPQGAPHDESAPGSHLELDNGQHDGAAFGFADPNEQAPTRSIMGSDHPRDPPKKSMMETKHEKKPKKDLRHFRHNNFPELPPMKSIMDHGR
jgi:hypothetical protein